MSGNIEYIAPSNELNKTLMYNNGFCFVLKKKEDIAITWVFEMVYIFISDEGKM